MNCDARLIRLDAIGRILDDPAKKVLKGLPEITGHRIIAKLGHGGMGDVYLAEQSNVNGRHVAVKMIRNVVDYKLTRFRTEISILADLNHRNIVPIFAADVSNGIPWYSMEVLCQGSLAERIAGGHLKCNPREATEIFLQIAEGMAVAHENGIIHRDLKPANIMFDEHGIPKIIDFSIARDSVSTAHTGHGTRLGTPGYMSPEQDRCEEAKPSSDIYSLGIIFYELLTDKWPVNPVNEKESDLFLRNIACNLKKMNVPCKLIEICTRCLQKEPAKRYRNGSELAVDLRWFLNDNSLYSRSRAPEKGTIAPVFTVGFVLLALLLLFAGFSYLPLTDFDPADGQAYRTETNIAKMSQAISGLEADSLVQKAPGDSDSANVQTQGTKFDKPKIPQPIPGLAGAPSTSQVQPESQWEEKERRDSKRAELIQYLRDEKRREEFGLPSNSKIDPFSKWVRLMKNEPIKITDVLVEAYGKGSP